MYQSGILHTITRLHRWGHNYLEELGRQELADGKISDAAAYADDEKRGGLP